MSSRALEICDLFGIPIARATMADATAIVDRAIEQRTRLLIGVVNAAKIVKMRRDAELDAAVRSADVIFADGASVVAASRLLGRPLPERVAGIDLMTAILARGSERGYRIFCLGATADVLARVVATIGDSFPGVEVVGAQHGYYGAGEEPQVADAVRQARADVLFVAMTSPKKERFLAAWGPTMNVPVCHGVGGSFDVMAGHVRRAPEIWQRAGLEWLYRVCQEPRRLWKRYLVTNLLFLGLLAGEIARTAPGRVARAVGWERAT